MKQTNSTWHKIWRMGKGRFALAVLVISMILAMLSSFVANERPLMAKYNGGWIYPVFHEIGESLGLYKAYPFVARKDWSEISFESAIRAPISFSPQKINRKSQPYLPPMSIDGSTQRTHYLGTDSVGRDVAAILIHGYKYAIWVGLFSLLLAGSLGICMGAAMGYFGDRGLRISFLELALSILMIGLMIFYAIHLSLLTSVFGLLIFMLAILCILWLLNKLFRNNYRPHAMFHFPLDLIMMRVLEVFRAVPNIFILLALMSLIAKPNIWKVIAIIGLLKWPAITRLMRGEVLNIRSEEYIKAAKTYGQSDFQIMLRHAIPNAIGPIIIALAFGVSNAILLEATISFLGIGVNTDQITWGNLLSNARGNFSAWWLAVFPGLTLFTLVLALNYLGDCLNDILNPKRSVSLS